MKKHEYTKLRDKYESFGVPFPMRLDKNYDYIRIRYNRKTHLNLNLKIYDYIFSNFDLLEDNFNVMCSWFCDIDLNYIKKLKFDMQKFNFFDFDYAVHESNEILTKNSFHCDVIFDELNLTGNFLQKYCEYTYPIGRVYKGKFILVGNNDDGLHICNPINSTKQLIRQNKIKNVYYETNWQVIREYDQKVLNYYMVCGDNL
jgi:hypothetical protein